MHNVVVDRVGLIVFLTDRVIEVFRRSFVVEYLQQYTSVGRHIAIVVAYTAFFVYTSHFYVISGCTVVALTLSYVSIFSNESSYVSLVVVFLLVNTEVSIKFTCECAILISDFYTGNLIADLLDEVKRTYFGSFGIRIVYHLIPFLLIGVES